MNVALEQTEEYSNGRLTGRFGECFLRGNNGEFSLLLSPHINPCPLNDNRHQEMEADEQFYTFQHWKIWIR